MIMRTIFALAAAALCFGYSNLQAQDKSNDTTARYFLIQVSIANLQEIAQGQLAVQQAGSPEVKAFGQRMIDDHGKAEAQLTKLAQTTGIQLPHEATDPPVDNPMLKKLNGKEFDKMYVHMMAPGHGETVQLFQKYIAMGKNPAVVAFAQQTLPVLKEHLAAINAIEEKMNK